MRKMIGLLVFLSFISPLAMGSSEYVPSVIYQLDQKFNHHVLVVEKSTHSLFLYKYAEDKPELVKKYTIMTGKFAGNKMTQGDKKTPEGIYFFQQFHSSQELLERYGDYGKIYGVGAFTTNYPNEMDKRAGKTGSGIWLHSAENDERVSLGLDSRGCVVAENNDLKDISQYIDLSNTPVVITQDLHYLSEENWNKNKKSILGVVNKWTEAWRNKDFESYINSYSKKEFKHKIRGRYNAFKTYKRAVFSRNDKPIINFTDISVLSQGDYVVVTMMQDYNSPVIKDIGKKTLYLKKNDNYEWKIVAEKWAKLDESRNIAFTPKMRYFTEQVVEKEQTDDSKSI